LGCSICSAVSALITSFTHKRGYYFLIFFKSVINQMRNLWMTNMTSEQKKNLGYSQYVARQDECR
tara:strand:+ start:1920 stop:2114 length:195 start_codon:yes stop_codon:yes gene_type:complete